MYGGFLLSNQGTVRSYFHFSERNNYGNEMNRVCLFLKTERKHVPRFLPETNIYNFHNYNKITKDVLSSFSQGEKGLLGHPGKRGKRGHPGSQGDQGPAGDAGLKGQTVRNYSI